MTRWLVNVEEDPETGDLVLPLPEDMLIEAGWQIGDTLIWNPQPDGSIILARKESDGPDALATDHPPLD